MTRAAPARLLGLQDRGRLGVGAAADLAIYREDADRERMFTTPEWVFKDGRLVARQGRIVAVPVGGTHYVEPDYDRSFDRTMRERLRRHGSVNPDHAVIGRDELCACCNGGTLLPTACFTGEAA
jgi:formylmethanofuran dehydrogenase subunit A